MASILLLSLNIGFCSPATATSLCAPLPAAQLARPTNNNRRNAQKIACARCALGPAGDRCRDKGRDCDPANAAFCDTARCEPLKDLGIVATGPGQGPIIVPLSSPFPASLELVCPCNHSTYPSLGGARLVLQREQLSGPVPETTQRSLSGCFSQATQ